jgi:hypothetical protein
MQVPEPRKVLLAQGVYYVVTGVSPFVSRRLFEAVTGPKRDWWLVKTTGILVTTIGCGTISAVLRGRETPEVAAMAAGCAAGLAAIDTVYALRGRISPVYLADAALELAAIAGSPIFRGTGTQGSHISDHPLGRQRVAH